MNCPTCGSPARSKENDHSGGCGKYWEPDPTAALDQLVEQGLAVRVETLVDLFASYENVMYRIPERTDFLRGWDGAVKTIRNALIPDRPKPKEVQP